MKVINKIEKVLNSPLLSKGLCYVPTHGASKQSIEKEEDLLGKKISKQHRTLLEKWDGINLEVLRFYGCTKDKETRQISECQFDLDELDNPIFFASEPAGYIYVYDKEEKIYLIDTDGWEITKIATSLEDFICNYVFGKRAAEFAGDEWFDEVKAAGLLED